MSRDIRSDGWWTKVKRNAARPIPDLWAFVCAKIYSRIWARYLGSAGANFHVSTGTRIIGARAVHVGDRFYMGPSLWIEAIHRFAGQLHSPTIRIGHRVSGSDFVHIAATMSVTIGDGVLLGSRVHITDHSHGRYDGLTQDAPDLPPAERSLISGGPVVIGRNVWLGDGVVVLAGVTIGDGCIVGANSVVTRSLPPGVIAVGAPARPIKRYDAVSRQWLAVPIDA